MLRVAIVGVGIGEKHLAAYKQLPDLFEIVWICDLDEARGRAVAAGLPFTTEFVDTLQDRSVDIVDICLPPHLHFDACEAALNAGYHVICEKPVVTSLREVERLAEIANANARQIFPVFQYRYGTGTAQLAALSKADLLGKPYVATLETHWNRDADYYAVDWRGTWAGENGGAILGHAIHIHDLVTGILGPVESVYADLATRVNGIEVEDCAALSLRMADGALVTSSVTLGAADDTSRLRLMFEKATVQSDDAPYSPAAKPWSFKARAPYQQQAIDDVLASVVDQPIGYAGLFTAISGALQKDGSDHVTLADARRSIEFVTAVYASARSNAPVKLPFDCNHPLYDGWLP